MTGINRLFNKLFASIYSISWVKNRWAQTYQSVKSDTIPWTPLTKSLNRCKVALLTTGGVHLKNDLPFNMEDPNGDPTFRIIPSVSKPHELMITHDYYNHRDADKDINLVYPIDVLHICQKEGRVGKSADSFYGLMGHVNGPHLKTLKNKTAMEIARRMRQETVDIAIFIPS